MQKGYKGKHKAKQGSEFGKLNQFYNFCQEYFSYKIIFHFINENRSNGKKKFPVINSPEVSKLCKKYERSF